MKSICNVARETLEKVYFSDIATGVIVGFGFRGYFLAVDYISDYLKGDKLDLRKLKKLIELVEESEYQTRNCEGEER